MTSDNWRDLLELLEHLFPTARIREVFTATVSAEWQKGLAKMQIEHRLEPRWLFEGARLCARKKPFVPGLAELEKAALEARDAAAAAARPPPPKQRDWLAEIEANRKRVNATPSERRRRLRLATPILVAEIATNRLDESRVEARLLELVELTSDELVAERARLAELAPTWRRMLEVAHA